MSILWRLALLSVAASGIVNGADAQTTCAVPAKTLSFDCGAACVAFEPCMRMTTVTPSFPSSCDLECLRIDKASPSSYNVFSFLIPFDDAVGDTATTASKATDELTAIAKGKLPGATRTIIIRGGNSLTEFEKGRVVTVDIARELFAGNPQVNYIHLDNINLAPTFATYAASFPSTTRSLWLRNTLLKSFPTEALAFPSLTTLSLQHNAVESFTALYPKLTILYLNKNRLTAVPAVISEHVRLKTLILSYNTISVFNQEHAVRTLETLDLAENLLSEIPPAIFKLATLRELHLVNNFLLENVTLTNEQADFIANLDTFSITSGAFSSNCGAAQQTQVRDFTVCITDGKMNPVIINATRAPSPAAASAIDSTASADDSNSALEADDDFEFANTPSAKSRMGGSTFEADADSTTAGRNREPASTTSNENLGSATESTGTQDARPGRGAGASTTTTYKKSARKAATTPIILGCVAGVFAGILVAGFVLVRKIQKDHAKASSITGHSSIAEGSAYYKSLWTDPDLLAVKVSASEVKDLQMIGQGAFCDVWLVKYRNAQQLASKRLHDVSIEQTQALVKEIKLVATLQHPGIVELVGAAWTKESDLQALFEYMENGDLRSYLVNERTSRSWTLEKVQIAIDVIEAMVYLHSFNPPLVHRDLKSLNILLSSEMQAKLSDFGVSRYQSEQNTMTAGVGTGCWLAPEVLSGSSDYGSAADVFSFGVVLSELDSHKLPYEDACDSIGNKLTDVALLELISTGALRLSFLPTCPPQIVKMADLCLSLRPENRPTAIQIAYVLRSIKKTMGKEL